MTVLAVTGLRREARRLAGPGVDVVVGGGDQRHLEEVLEARVAGASGIISMGIAGGLAPDLRCGQWVVASAIVDGGGHVFSTDATWTHRLAARLPGAAGGLFLGVDAMIVEQAEKVRLHRTTQAIAVDMESHVAARVAARHRRPFAAARVICDPAHRTLPPAARVGMRSDGHVDVAAVLHSLVARPGQIPDLMRTAWEAERAFRSLLRGHRVLGAGLAGPDLA